MRLPEPKTGTRRRSETRDIVAPILRALNSMPGVRVVRNANLGPVVPWAKRFDPDARPIVAGLGAGSADVVGVVRMSDGVGRLFALECKLPPCPGKRAGAMLPDQVRWMWSVRRMGGHCSVVHSVDEALAAVEACRAGQ
jgi:hypothetical protein